MARKVHRSEAPTGSDVHAPDQGMLGLEVVVVVAGAVLMSMEIVGSRLLAPHFGNSVFVWGSLISVFLAALSLGYWFGGRVADRGSPARTLRSLCVAVAALIFLIPWTGHPICRALEGSGLGEQGGPLVAAVILFLPPSFLLGMVSPLSVRIATRDLATVGRAAGGLYALSTLGSIGGTLLTTFVLIPLLGVSWILKGLALAMLALPVGLWLAGIRGKGGGSPIAAAVVAIVGLLVPSAPSATLQDHEVVVLDEDTPYHHVQVVDASGRIRMLKFDRYVESSIDLLPPHPTFSEYTDYFHLALLIRPEPRRVLFIGAGGGIGPRTFLESAPGSRIDVVDVDARVLEIARDLFHMPDDERLRPIAADGRMFLRDAEPGYDVIVLDAFTIGGRIPFHLATKEAFELCRDRLAPGGVFVMNINSSLGGGTGEIFASIGATLREAFPHVQAFAHEVRFDPDPSRSRNILYFARADEPLPSAEEWRRLAAGFVARSSVSADSVREMARDLLPSLEATEGAIVLTDDHAPIETMGF